MGEKAKEVARHLLLDGLPVPNLEVKQGMDTLRRSLGGTVSTLSGERARDVEVSALPGLLFIECGSCWKQGSPVFPSSREMMRCEKA